MQFEYFRTSVCILQLKYSWELIYVIHRSSEILKFILRCFFLPFFVVVLSCGLIFISAHTKKNDFAVKIICSLHDLLYTHFKERLQNCEKRL